MQPPDLHPVLKKRLDAAAEVWRGVRGTPVGGGSRKPNAAEIVASELALGVRFPNSYLYFCSAAASLLDSSFKLPTGEPQLSLNTTRHFGRQGTRHT